MADPQAENSDADSALGEDVDHESTTSVLEVPQFTENGRTYHGQGYPLPNDESEKDRLDFQNKIFHITFDGKLYTCPVEKPQRVLDVGTGTGIWAMDFGDAHPEADVLGIDLSPSQPEWVPPNVRFQLDDLEQDWEFSDLFSFIYCRDMTFAFSDWPRFFKQCWDNLEPGGYIEAVDITFPVASDDDTICDTTLKEWSSLLLDASRIAKRRIDNAKFHKERLLEAGFEDVVEKIYKWPQNVWPKEQRFKNLAMHVCDNFRVHVSGLSLALLTRYGEMSWEEVEVLLARVRKDFTNKSIHAYFNIYVVWGRKPVNQQV